MSYVPIPKDLDKIKSKLIAGLTKRQLIGIICAGVTSVPTFLLVWNIVPQTVAMFILVLVATPSFIITLYNRNDIPAEEWIKNYLKHKYLRNRIRVYKKPLMTEVAIQKRVKRIEKRKRAERIQAQKLDLYSSPYLKLNFDNMRKRETLPGVLGRCLVRIYKEHIKDEVIPAITSQQTLDYKEIYKDGLCKIDDTHWSMMITFWDVNYSLAEPSVKNKIFFEWCDFLNSFEEAMHVQLTFINKATDIKEVKKIPIELQRDGDDQILLEYQTMLQDQLAKRSHGITKSKYITFTIESRSAKDARRRLSRIITNSKNILNKMGVRSFHISGTERLQIFNDILNHRRLKFNWDKCEKSGLRTQDFISPKKYDFSDKRYFKTDKKYFSTLMFELTASELNDTVLTDFLDMESEMVLTFHIDAMNQQRASKFIKGKISDLGKMKIDENKKAVRMGYDMDTLPPDLVTYEEESKRINHLFQTENEKWFRITALITPIAEKKSLLDNSVLQARSIALMHSCDLIPYDFDQENCLLSVLPIGLNRIYPRRGLNTRALAVFVPFTTQDLIMDGKALFYGLNAISKNPIIANRKKLHNPNGLILGGPGSGKSFFAKKEIVGVYYGEPDDRIIICDPEGEYSRFVRLLKGQVIEISAISKVHINPLDIDMDYSGHDNDSPITIKTDFIISMMELLCANKKGLEPHEVSLIDRCTRIIYQKYLENPIPENIPILEDLYNALKQESTQGTRLADSLEIYVHGSMKVFNNRTNVDMSNRLICFNIQNLGKTLRKFGMLMIQDKVWQEVARNRDKGFFTWFIQDEFHLLLKDALTSNHSIENWKRLRKHNGVPTGITQNVNDFLANKEIGTILENTDFFCLLKQEGSDKEELAKRFNLSDSQLKYVENPEQGCGLIKYGGLILPLEDDFPKDTLLYKVMTTKPEEVKRYSELLNSLGLTGAEVFTSEAMTSDKSHEPTLCPKCNTYNERSDSRCTHCGISMTDPLFEDYSALLDTKEPETLPSEEMWPELDLQDSYVNQEKAKSNRPRHFKKKKQKMK